MNLPDQRCMMRETLEAATPEDLFEVLGRCVLITDREVTKDRGCYGCGRCALPMTVEYPDFDAPVATTGIALGAHPQARCEDPQSAELVDEINAKFEKTEAIRH